jgi:hypothetical protein
VRVVTYKGFVNFFLNSIQQEISKLNYMHSIEDQIKIKFFLKNISVVNIFFVELKNLNNI